MIRSPRQRRLYLGSILFAIAPVACGVFRAVSSQYDLRMLWMALASFAGATLVMVLGRSRRRESRALYGLSALAFAVATLCAGWTAIRLGATAPFGIWAVASVLSASWAASYALDALAWPRAA